MKGILLYDYALRFVGLPYRWGGDDPMAGFDCSGLAQELLAAVGADPPGDQTAQSLYEHFKGTGPGTTKRSCGCLAFYGKDLAHITHVAMLIDDLHVIEAGGGNASTTSVDAAARQNAYVRVRPLNHRKDLVAVIRWF